MDIYAEASAAAMAIVRTAARGTRRGGGPDIGQITREYAERVCRDQGLTDVAEPLALLVGALAQLGGAAMLALMTGADGQPPPADQLEDRLDGIELALLAQGGLRHG